MLTVSPLLKQILIRAQLSREFIEASNAAIEQRDAATLREISKQLEDIGRDASHVNLACQQLELEHGDSACLYRYYDTNGRLLYIGISLSLVARLAQHSRGKHWSRQAARITIEHYPSRDQAAMAERNAIKLEKPAHNIVHNQR